MKIIKFGISIMLIAISTNAPAADDSSATTCGWDVLDHPEPKIFYPIMTTFNPTGALVVLSGSSSDGSSMASGTSGCLKDGVVSSTSKTVMYIDGSKSKLAQDMSKGSGEYLASLALLLGIKDNDRLVFYRAAQVNFSQIFVTEHASTGQIVDGLKQVLATVSDLAQYAEQI